MALSTLNYDVGHLIQSQLSDSDIHAFRGVSKACKAFTDARFYSCITLYHVLDDCLRDREEETNDLREETHHYIRRLLDPKDGIRRLVRWLKIQDSKKEFPDEVGFVDKVDRIVRVLAHLTSISWCTELELPETTSSHIESRFPDCKLFVKDPYIFWKVTKFEVDGGDDKFRLLSSPLLHSLYINHMTWCEPQWPRRNDHGPCYTDHALFINQLSKMPRLHHLSICFAETGPSSDGIELELIQEDQLQLRAPQTEESLPLLLHTLTIRGSFCWESFLSALTGRVPNLRCLKLDRVWPDQGASLHNLLKSIHGLEVIRLKQESDRTSYFPAIMTHKATLTHLNIDSYRGAPLSNAELDLLAEQFPRLESLGLHFRAENVSVLERKGWSDWDHGQLRRIARIQRLKFLHVYIEYPGEDEDLTPDMCQLFRLLCRYSPQPAILKELRVQVWGQFWWPQKTDVVCYLVKRTEQNGLDVMDEGGLWIEVFKEESPRFEEFTW